MIKSISEREIPESRFGKKGAKRSVYRDDVKAFLEGDNNVCECFRSGNKKVSSNGMAQSYRHAVKDMKAPIKVLTRGDRVFMIKETGDA